ncbi:MAG: outer membrane protein assembly factor BamA [Ignavibacteria bacterium]|nr:outer membrane protein assembly factor BamA [Ignavibacteria bacterium]MCC7159637.1 outer membrane protein assembly factor BamA [Ignavibacteria bacterium]
MLYINRSFLTVLALLIIFSSITYCQEGPRTYKILSVSVEGNKFYDSRIIISNSGLKIGDEISVPSEATQQAIMNLWNMRLFSDVEIAVDKKIGDGAYLIIKVKELPKLDNMKFSGNDEFSDKDLEEKIPLEKGQVITQQTVKDIEYNLVKLYEEEGYPLAEVKVDQFVNSFNEAQLRVKIEEGSKISVRKIRFSGNSKVSSSDLKGAMEETAERKWWKFWDKARFNRKDYEKDKDFILQYYKEKGYKDAEIVEDDLQYKNNKEDIDIIIKVKEGPRYKVGSIDFIGNTVYNDTLLRERLDLKRGDVYNSIKLNQNLRGNESQTDIASLYLDNGYLGFQANVEEDPKENNIVNLKIDVSENRQYRIGLISFSGNTKTQDKVIRRELFTIPGQYFNKTAMVRSMQQMSQLNYFNPEVLNYDFVQRNDSTVDLVYVVEERSSDQLNASVGYSQTFGFSGSLGLTFNNFDITDPLSGGAGQILSLQWDFGTEGTYRTFRIGFTEPWLFNTPTSAGIDVYDTKQKYTYEIQETGSTLNIGRRFKFPDDYFRGDWFLKFQRTNVIQGADIYETGLRSQFSIGQVISRNSTNSPIYPSVGSKVTLSAEIAGANLVGTTNFYKLGFKTEAFKSLDNSGKLVLASNFDIQSISSLSSDNYVPPNELFFMGGSGLTYNTIALRGYDDRTLGPVNIAGNPVGGRFMMKYGVELRYSLSQDPIPIFLTMFAEAGNLWPNFKVADLLDLKRSVGFGARLMLPAVGIIGFDLGYGFDRKVVDGQDPSWLFHFQFGKGF